MRWLALASLMLAMPAFAQTPTLDVPIKVNPLDISTVTTGGTAVLAINPGGHTMGGWIYNPATATIPLCINELATASGTTTAGSLTCIPQDRTYYLTRSTGGVSVISSDSTHPFSGYGFTVTQ